MNNLAHVIWPAMILALHETAILVRMTRSSMLEVLRQDYMRTAHAKGLAPLVWRSCGTGSATRSSRW